MSHRSAWCVYGLPSRQLVLQCQWHADAGKTPVWNEVNKFPITGKEGNFKLEVWDKNQMLADSFIGGVVVPLHNVLSTGHETNRVILTDTKGKTAGEVELMLIFHKVGSRLC